MSLDIKPCRKCGGRAEYIEGSYSADGREDRAFTIKCTQCGESIYRMPIMGEGNYWWQKPDVGRIHTRDVLIEEWNTKYKEHHADPDGYPLCPFCGGNYREIEDHPTTCYIRCLVDNFDALYRNDPSKQHTADEMDSAWNNRHGAVDDKGFIQSVLYSE